MSSPPTLKPSERLAARANGPPKANSLSTFLNSSFGMWLITVAIFGTALKWFTNETKHNEEAAKIRAELRAKDLNVCSTIARLDLEVGYRLTQVQTVLYEGSLQKTAKARAVSGKEAMDMLRRAPLVAIDLRYLSLYPQYNGYGIPALVAELRRLEETPIQMNCPVRSIWEGHRGLQSKSTDPSITQARTRELQQVLAHLTGLAVFFKVRRVALDQPKKMAGEIVEGLALKRWKVESGWYFLEEGDRSEPFP